MIDQQMAQHFVDDSECLCHPFLPFYAIQTITLFLLKGSQQITLKGWNFS